MAEEEDAYALLARGLELLDEGNPAQAALVLERARAAAPSKGSILEALGRAYYSHRRFDAASKCFSEAIEVDPANDYAHYCMGLCCLKHGKKTRAAGHFKLAWCMKPDEAYREMAGRFGAAGAVEPGAPGAG